MKYFLTTILCIYFFNYVVHAQQLYINEIMSANTSVLYDHEGDTPDWIELFNYGTDTICLRNYFLSDNKDDLEKWRFPEISIYPSEYKIVYASGKDITTNSEIHTNFSIDSDGEEILLSDSAGVIIQRFLPIKLSENISFGSKPDACYDMVYFDQPSPGFSNDTCLSHLKLTEVEFSVEGGFYDDGFELFLNHQDPDATILFTIDGSEPTLSNIPYKTYKYKNSYPLEAGTMPYEFMTDTIFTYYYQIPIRIPVLNTEPFANSYKSSSVFENPVTEFPLLKAYTIRAKAIKDGMEESDCKTYTYFIKDDAISLIHDLPIVSINCQSDDLFDYYRGIYTAGVDFDNWRLQNPYEEVIWPVHGNFKRRGKENQINVNIEYFDRLNDTASINTMCGLRINGGETRSFPMKALRLCPDLKYGCDRLNYKFFNEIDDTSFQDIVLRNSGNDFPTSFWEPSSSSRTMLRDAYIQYICRNMNVETQAYQPVIVFINGEFWGLHNIREKYDKEYFKRVYDIDYDELEFLSDNASIIEGGNWHYNNLINYISVRGTVSEESYLHIARQMDIVSFIDFMIAEIFVHNTDWPVNNTLFWRKKTYCYESEAELAHDGRWRWALTDMDLGFGLHDFAPDYQQNTIEYLLNPESPVNVNSSWSVFLFSSLLENNEFKTLFLQRFEFHLQNTFNPSVTVPVLDSLASKIQNVMPYHLQRWSDDYYMSDWHEAIKQMKIFAIERPCELREMLKDYFNINDSNYAYGVCENDIVKSDDYCACLKLYPNPVADILKIKFPDTRYYASDIRIFEITGKAVTAYTVYIFDSDVEINVENLSSGLYCVYIVNGDETCMMKFYKN